MGTEYLGVRSRSHPSNRRGEQALPGTVFRLPSPGFPAEIRDAPQAVLAYTVSAGNAVSLTVFPDNAVHGAILRVIPKVCKAIAYQQRRYLRILCIEAAQAVFLTAVYAAPLAACSGFPQGSRKKADKSPAGMLAFLAGFLDAFGSVHRRISVPTRNRRTLLVSLYQQCSPAGVKGMKSPCGGLGAEAPSVPILSSQRKGR